MWEMSVSGVGGWILGLVCQRGEGSFPYHGVRGGRSKHHTLEASRAPQEGWRRVRGRHYGGSWNGNSAP